MTVYLTLAAMFLGALLTLLFSTLTYALRDFSRTRLAEYLERHGKADLAEKTIELCGDLVFVTAICRLFMNILILVAVLHLLNRWGWSEWARYVGAVAATGILTLFFSVALPHAFAQHAGETVIGFHVRFLHALRVALLPATGLMHWVDRVVERAVGFSGEPTTAEAEQEIQQEILSVVEEGEKEGVVDEQERAMIVSVIQFHDTQVGQVMTARPEIIALPLTASLAEVKQLLEESGHSRVPVYDGTLDHIVGVLYARDLLKHLGEPPDRFDIRAAMRPAFYVPETRSLRDLLQDFRLQKVHMAIVLDEYGGTAGLVTIEDVLEELVGEISDEHEPQEPAAIKRIDERTYEIDARAYLDLVNRKLRLGLPENAGYETIGGFVSNTLGRIPQPGTVFDYPGARFTILDAEPQKVNRVKVELVPQEAEVGSSHEHE